MDPVLSTVDQNQVKKNVFLQTRINSNFTEPNVTTVRRTMNVFFNRKDVVGIMNLLFAYLISNVAVRLFPTFLLTIGAPQG